MTARSVVQPMSTPRYEQRPATRARRVGPCKNRLSRELWGDRTRQKPVHGAANADARAVGWRCARRVFTRADAALRDASTTRGDVRVEGRYRARQ